VFPRIARLCASCYSPYGSELETVLEKQFGTFEYYIYFIIIYEMTHGMFVLFLWKEFIYLIYELRI
jgi:hypothetical protein